MHCAFEILRLHATDDDLDWLRRRLARTSPHADGDTYVLRKLAQIISARFPGRPFPTLGRRFDAFTYSYGRKYVAEALAVTDPTFPRTRAFTALWDCESSVRAIAAEHVSLDLPGALERLQDIAADPIEDEHVLEVIALRLNEPATS